MGAFDARRIGRRINVGGFPRLCSKGIRTGGCHPAPCSIRCRPARRTLIHPFFFSLQNGQRRAHESELKKIQISSLRHVLPESIYVNGLPEGWPTLGDVSRSLDQSSFLIRLARRQGRRRLAPLPIGPHSTPSRLTLPT